MKETAVIYYQFERC